MPPRASADCDEPSLRDASWTSYETEANKMNGAISASQLNNNNEDTPSRTIRVSFAPTAKVRQIVKITREQAKDVWFNNDDFQRMKKSFAPTVQLMAAGALTPEESANSEEHCTRGLEYRTKDGARRRMKNKYDGMAAVLHEQDRQLFEDTRDDEQLAKVYIDVNCKCSFEALALGRRDEQDVKDYLTGKGESSERSADDSTVASTSSSASVPAAPKRFQKLKSSGSFHERSLRSSFKGLKRVFSGSKLLRRNQPTTAVA
ncbi:expressed unknown protein [Seminavis robusta]|uniref:Uncharacterized protein n=1 Tax=Seminavis robusta TaxID=568900 RepID=A0A9N8H6Y5_9STRA|nr:expressed unknown protein [Seminavis robusta]|eukprot:Sro125_g060250.1 n/a (260) ;mRNA; r:64128-64907